MKTPSLKIVTLTLMAGAAALSLVSAADARGPGGDRERPAFEEIDANGDGGITLEEIRTHAESRGAARFAATDTDGDGNLSREEVAAAARENAGDRALRRFDRMDANDDGVISQDEIQARRGGDGDRGGRRGGMERMFERADADSDGSISAAEWAEMPKGRERR